MLPTVSTPLFLRASLLVLCSALSILHSTANNIQATNGALSGDNGTQLFVQFDLSWENSWLFGSDQRDAAWVFVKFRGTDGLWRHCSLDNSGHVAPSGSTITPGLVAPASAFNASTNPAVGAFIYRNADGNGTFTANAVQLRWNYSVDNIAAIDVQEVRVFAIEMVLVPQGAFAAGSGGAETNAFTLTTINTANATMAPSGTGSLGGQAGGFPTGQFTPSTASWPNGFNAFYCMKYEVTQQGYVDFLNTLTRTQQNTRTGTDISGTAITNRYVMSNSAGLSFRNGIRCDATLPSSPAPVTFYCDLNGNGAGGEASDGKDIACNYLSWGDLSAYLDWSGLRPMTELEFEKACRGTIAPVANEYPWGTNGLAGSAYTLANAGATNEGIAANYSTTLGNASLNATDGAINGPLRVGIFAAAGSNGGRVTAGASYYGIMELGGNLLERAVNIDFTESLEYTGVHGNGGLAAGGSGDATTWPATSAGGTGFRGGAFNTNATDLQVSDRLDAASNNSFRINTTSGRGVRMAP